MSILLDGTNGITSVTGQAATAVAGPAFSAKSAGNQTISATTYTKVTLGTENFDTNSNFASSRFTPTVEGYYQINGSINIVSGNNGIVSLYKNGSAAVFQVISGTVASGIGSVSVLMYMNGSTDYVELYAYSSSTTVNTNGTQMSGCLVRGA